MSVVAGFIPAWRGVVSLRGVKGSRPPRGPVVPKQSTQIATNLSGAHNDKKRAGTRPAPTTLNKQIDNYVVARFILALWVGCWYKLM